MITSDDLFTEEFNLEPVEPLEVFEENGEPNPDVEDGNGGEDEAKEVSTVVKPKRVIRNPQPKLNEERLKGPKGLPAVEKHFEKVKYKGKGYEEQDLNTILKTYEYWCHRMFPKFPFDESIAKIEKLGSKKTVQNHMKRMRLGMELEDIEKQQVHVNDDNEDQPREDFDALLGEIEDNELEEISEEQLERMRLNRERAEKLKQERLEKAKGMAQTCLEDSRSIQETYGSSNQRTRKDSSSSEEDIDVIFHRLNSSKENSAGHDVDGNKEFLNAGTSKNTNFRDNSEEEDFNSVFDKLSSSNKNTGGHDLDRNKELLNPETSKHGNYHEISEEEALNTEFDKNQKSDTSRVKYTEKPSETGNSVQTNFHSDSSEDEDIDTMLEKLNSNKLPKKVPDSDRKESAGELSGEEADEIMHEIN